MRHTHTVTLSEQEGSVRYVKFFAAQRLVT